MCEVMKYFGIRAVSPRLKYANDESVTDAFDNVRIKWSAKASILSQKSFILLRQKS